jgi:hypothetical protein
VVGLSGLWISEGQLDFHSLLIEFIRWEMILEGEKTRVFVGSFDRSSNRSLYQWNIDRFWNLFWPCTADWWLVRILECERSLYFDILW